MTAAVTPGREELLALAHAIELRLASTGNALLTGDDWNTVVRALHAAADGIADKERFDFLDRCNERLNASYGTSYSWELILNHNVNRLMLGHLLVDLNDARAHGLPSCRDAIDAEIKRIRSLSTTGEQKP